MSNNTEEQITQNVLSSMAQTPNPRLKKVMDSLIVHLHDFIRDVELTQEEWTAAIQFLTRTGQMCDDKRQEFILLVPPNSVVASKPAELLVKGGETLEKHQ